MKIPMWAWVVVGGLGLCYILFVLPHNEETAKKLGSVILTGGILYLGYRSFSGRKEEVEE